MPVPSSSASPPAPSGAGRRRLTWALVLLFVVSLPAVTPRIYASDEVQYFAFLRSLWFDHDLSFDNEYRHFYDSGVTRTELFRETYLKMTTPTGRRINYGSMGCAILWAPFYAVADAGVRLARMAGSTVAADGYSKPYIAAVCYGSAVYGWLALLLSLAIARRIVPGFDGLPLWRQALPVLVVWVGTPLVFYTHIAPPFAHACSAFAVSAFVLAWLHVRRHWTPAGFAALGALAALMAMVREQDALLAVGPALDLAWTLGTRAWAAWAGRPRGRRQVGALVGGSAVGALAFAVVYIPQALAYLTLNGRLGPSTQVSRKMTWTSPHALEVLFSPQWGLFAWTPLALLALAGVVVLAARPTPARRDREAAPGASDTRRIAICLLVMAAAAVYIVGSVESWTVAGGFGQRRFVCLTAVLAVGLAALVTRATRRPARRVVAGLLVIGTWWNLALMVEFATGLMDRKRLSLGQNAYDAFVTVPVELPRLAYRYLFDRQSFYAAPRE